MGCPKKGCFCAGFWDPEPLLGPIAFIVRGQATGRQMRSLAMKAQKKAFSGTQSQSKNRLYFREKTFKKRALERAAFQKDAFYFFWPKPIGTDL
jgi:hypothetical protein